MNAVSLLPKGTPIVRYIRALALARGSLPDAAEIAADLYGPSSGPARWTRAASQAGSTLPSGDWGSELADFTLASQEFFGLVRERSIPGRMGGLRRVPLAVKLLSQTGEANASWVKELAAKPVSEMIFAASIMAPLKIAALAVVTVDLIKLSSPAAEGWLRDALVNALVKTLNESFIDPGNAGTADIEPASITSGAPSVAATGVWADDLAALLALFTGDLESAYFVTNGIVASGLSGPAQPNLTVRGGELSGVPVVVDKAVPAGTLVLADVSEIVYGESLLRVETSMQGSLLMDSQPAGPAIFSLWQSNCVALRAEQGLNWQTMKPGSTVVMTGV